MAAQKGFTLIEVMIVVAILGILAAVVMGGNSGGRSNTYCAGGYVFDVRSGKQVLDENGGGVPCNGVTR